MLQGFSEFSLEAPGCHPGVNVFGAHFGLNSDVTELFPYINRVTENATYYEKPHYIQFILDNWRVALYPNVVKGSSFDNREEALIFFDRLCDFLNEVEAGKDTIEPDHSTYKPIPVLEVFKLLPRTNCRQCGYQTCMAFAAGLSQKETGLDQCPELCDSANENISLLLAMGL